MKNLFLLLFSFLALGSITAQEQAGSLKVDTESQEVNDAPFSVSGKIGPSVRASIKKASAIGLPADHYIGVNLTVSPWWETGLGYDNQLNFNWSGIYYRRSNDNLQWNKWQKIMMTNQDGHFSVGEYSKVLGEGNRLYFEGANTTNDYLFISKYAVNNYNTDLRVNIGENRVATQRFVVGCTYYADKKWYSSMVVTAAGNVGIGVENPTNALEVNGTIRAKQVRVETGWADFVFDKEYNLPSLNEVKAHIDEHKHLPGIPTEAEVKENGVDLAEIQVKLLQKVEELTLYAIQQQEQLQKQNQEIENLKSLLSTKK